MSGWHHLDVCESMKSVINIVVVDALPVIQSVSRQSFAYKLIYKIRFASLSLPVWGTLNADLGEAKLLMRLECCPSPKLICLRVPRCVRVCDCVVNELWILPASASVRPCNRVGHRLCECVIWVTIIKLANQVHTHTNKLASICALSFVLHKFRQIGIILRINSCRLA